MKIEKVEPYFYVLPAGIILLTFLVYPMIRSFSYSFIQWDGLDEPIFVGLTNYKKLLLDPVFWHSLKNTGLWVVMSGVLLSVGGLLLAFLVEYGTGGS